MRRAWLAVLLVACSSDDAIDVDAGEDDATMDSIDAADVPDVLPLGEPYYVEEPYPPVNEAGAFQEVAAHVLCNRMSNCCAQLDAGAFDTDACAGGLGLEGFRGSNAELLLPGVLDGGHLVFDPTAAFSCLAGITTLSCPDMTSSEVIMTWANCNAAVTGSSAIGGPCRADIECVQAAYCDTTTIDAGKCVALGGQDAACQRTDQCAYKGGPAPLYCNGSTCQPRLTLDASCATNDACESGICASAACASSYAISACALPDGGP